MFRPVPSSGSDSQLAYTVGEMYRLARTYAGDLAPFGVDRLSDQELFDLVRTVPYIPDRRLSAADELLQRPASALSGGDCDDKTILAGAAFNLRGDTWRIKTVGFSPGGPIVHTYPEILTSAGWRPFDATYHWNVLYQVRPAARTITWRNPQMTKTRSFANGSRVATLEGSGLGLLPPAVAAKLIDVSGIFDSIGDVLQKIPILGSLFRGKTGHVDFDTAVARQRMIGSKAVELYNKLDAAGRTLMYDLSRSFFENHILPGWGHYWDNAISNDYATWGSKGFLRDAPTSIYHWLSMPVFYFLTLEDITRVEDSLQAWYTGPVETKVFGPVSSYVENKYGVNLDQINESGTISDASTAGVAGSKTVALLAAGGLLLLAASAPKSRGPHRR